MSELKAIEVDFDIHKMIEAERRGFGEPPFMALRRLLKLPDLSPPAHSTPEMKTGRAWTGDGATLSHGTKLRMDYNQRRYEGFILDGEWVIDGQKFSSPSGAASGVAITKSGDKTKLDGWGYWEVMQPGDTSWTALKNLRRAKRIMI